MSSSDLILPSLEVRRFRGIPELRVSRLGRANLIVGKNNVGKSTVLEALRLFAQPGSLDALLAILESRNEMEPEDGQDWNPARGYPLPVHYLFHGRRPTLGEAGAILIGPADAPREALRISLETTLWPQPPGELGAGGGHEEGEPREAEKGDVLASLKEKQMWVRFRLETAERFFSVRQPPLPPAPGPLSAHTGRERSVGTFRSLPRFSVGPNGLDPGDIGKLWDKVALSTSEQDVITALRIISPGVDRVALKEPANRPDRRPPAPYQSQGPRARIPFVKLRDDERPVPFRSLGDGMNRMFGIALALVNARGGFLLVDEIENGVHYSVQADMWRLIFKTAPRLNVQVFATTHSYDCIKAFEEAARESEEEGVLIRLAQKAGRTLVGEFDENELGIAVEGQIEVR